MGMVSTQGGDCGEAGHSQNKTHRWVSHQPGSHACKVLYPSGTPRLSVELMTYVREL